MSFLIQRLLSLRYDSHGKRRELSEQKYKIGLLPLVIPVIQLATSVADLKKAVLKPLGKYYEIWELKEVVGNRRL